ncbi:tRNA pseudouridine(38-40) synthase TruA [Kordiimonas pumila]|uniref:tRNA pseudouridine synthase A n=1 Tax=Kordiimonas pumila TaxID=2161677 RepID=A0ABV7DA03_9PROT|nr:tRNA pseudouridine(38-40) synthase TruA [Kordiimonas pumila]
MQRFRLLVEYDGRPFSGWQRQAGTPSVQETLEEAARKIAPHERIVVHGSGRTDAGVHARGQVAHIDLEREISADNLQGALNYHTKGWPVSVLKSEVVPDSFHARFSAKKRHYIYRIINRRARLTFDKGLAWHVKTPLDADAMQDAAQVLVGQHDFTTFRHIHCQAKSPVKTVDYIHVERQGDELLVKVGALSFLHHQIRSFTGTLQLVGLGKWTKADLKAALEARDRTALGLNAPSDGLYFDRVEYDCDQAAAPTGPTSMA